MRNYAPEIIAPDRYTGQEGRSLEAKLEYHLENHPDRNLDVRVTRLEAQYEITIKNQDRIIQRLDGIILRLDANDHARRQ